jgi:hypothetical protein
VGKQLHPAEFLYFRQDQKLVNQKNKCWIPNCPRPPHVYQPFCIVHIKEQEDKAIKIIVKLTNLISRWEPFIRKLEQLRPSADEPNVVCLGSFIDTVRQYSGYRFTKNEVNILVGAFMSKNE